VRAWVVLGEPAVGTFTAPATRLTAGFLAAVGSTGTRDTTPPTGTITINNGAAYTASPTVTLTLSATDDSGVVAEMRFSNDGTTYTAPEPYATTKAWTLTSGDGTKTVSVKFADRAGNWSAPASDAIILDTVDPSVRITAPPDGAVLTGP